MKAIIHHTEEKHRGRLFTFTVEDVTLPNGVRTEMAMVRHPGSTGIIPVTENGQVVMTRQYRHVVRDYLLEIPAGTMERGESPEGCARRELEEETGLVASKFIFLGYVHILPAYSDEKIYLFLARGFSTSRQNLDRDEILQVERHPLKAVLNMIDTGQITDALTVLAIQRVRNYFEQSNVAP